MSFNLQVHPTSLFVVVADKFALFFCRVPHIWIFSVWIPWCLYSFQSPHQGLSTHFGWLWLILLWISRKGSWEHVPEFLNVHNSFSADFMFECQFDWREILGNCGVLLFWDWQTPCYLPLCPSAQWLIPHGSCGPICPPLAPPVWGCWEYHIVYFCCWCYLWRIGYMILVSLFYDGRGYSGRFKKLYNYLNSTTYQKVWL